MKKFLTFALVCCLVFSSSSTVFATATQWDTSDQANLRYIYQSLTSGGSLYNLVNSIYTRVNTISNNLTDIKSYLFDSNHGIAYWVHAISTWMSPIYTAIQNTPTELESIKRLLGYVSYEGETEVITPYLAYGTKGIAELVADYFDSGWGTGWWDSNKRISMLVYGSANGTTTNYSLQLGRKFPQDLLQFLVISSNNELQFLQRITGYVNQAHTLTSWTDLSTSSTTPYSLSQGVLNFLENIQAPVARLSYVLASDERIEAQEKAADNEQAVVDNFIDSSGSGAASTSDFGSVSDLSSGFKNNISTDASVSGIWNIFNADNFGWFSQETADQLDTSGSGNRTLRSSGSYPTPLLDQQTEDIMKILGGNNND